MTAALVRHWMTRHDRSRDDDVHRREVATGHPPIPADALVLERLRARVHGRNVLADEPIGWWNRDGGAWAAVTDLHRAGDHDGACALARLLHWCDQWRYGPGEGTARMWTLDPGVEPPDQGVLP